MTDATTDQNKAIAQRLLNEKKGAYDDLVGEVLVKDDTHEIGFEIARLDAEGDTLATAMGLILLDGAQTMDLRNLLNVLENQMNLEIEIIASEHQHVSDEHAAEHADERTDKREKVE